MSAVARRVPLHYGWVIVIAGILANGVSAGGLFWVMTVYVPAISDDFDVPRSGVVLAFMTGWTIAALMGPIAGRYVDAHGARRALLVGSVAMPLAIVATSTASELWQLFLGWGVVSVVRAFVFPMPYNWLITRWFEGRRQAALGVVTVGFGLGGAAVMPLLAAIEDRHDWSAAMVVSAALIFVVHGTAALLIVRDRPSDVGMAPEGAEPGEALPASQTAGFTAGQALRTPLFWLIAVGLMFFFMGQGAVLTLSVDFFDSRNISNGAAIVAAGALLRTVARLPLGLSLSRVRRVFGLAIVVALSQTLAVGALLASTSPAGIAVHLLLWGLGGAFAPMLDPLLVTRSFGVRHYGAVSGSVAMVAFGGQIIGPVGGAVLFDATGSYTLAFSLYSAGFLLSAALFAAASLRLRSSARIEADRGAGTSQTA